MSVKPILFNTDMVRAILDGRKTETRRLIKQQIKEGHYSVVYFHGNDYIKTETGIINPPYQAGDILYVRETWQYIDFVGENNGYVYRASENGILWETESENWTWRPSIHMPKEAARIFLKVTNVRVERLQEITWQEAAREGCYGSTSDEPDLLFHLPTLKGEFQKLWGSTIKKSDLDKYGWEANPWVWVIEFERIEVK